MAPRKRNASNIDQDAGETADSPAKDSQSPDKRRMLDDGSSEALDNTGQPLITRVDAQPPRMALPQQNSNIDPRLLHITNVQLNIAAQNQPRSTAAHTQPPSPMRIWTSQAQKDPNNGLPRIWNNAANVTAQARQQLATNYAAMQGDRMAIDPRLLQYGASMTAQQPVMGAAHSQNNRTIDPRVLQGDNGRNTTAQIQQQVAMRIAASRSQQNPAINLSLPQQNNGVNRTAQQDTATGVTAPRSQQNAAVIPGLIQLQNGANMTAHARQQALARNVALQDQQSMNIDPRLLQLPTGSHLAGQPGPQNIRNVGTPQQIDPRLIQPGSATNPAQAGQQLPARNIVQISNDPRFYPNIAHLTDTTVSQQEKANRILDAKLVHVLRTDPQNVHAASIRTRLTQRAEYVRRQIAARIAAGNANIDPALLQQGSNGGNGVQQLPSQQAGLQAHQLNSQQAGLQAHQSASISQHGMPTPRPGNQMTAATHANTTNQLKPRQISAQNASGQLQDMQGQHEANGHGQAVLSRAGVTQPLPTLGVNTSPQQSSKIDTSGSAPTEGGSRMIADSGQSINGQQNTNDTQAVVQTGNTASPRSFPRPTTDLLGRQNLFRIRQSVLKSKMNGQRYIVGPNLKPEFSMIEAFTSQSDLLLVLVQHLSLPSILSLYSIDRKFHFLFNANYTAYITALTRVMAPDAWQIFPWKLYKSLCLRDPHGNKTARMSLGISSASAPFVEDDGRDEDIRIIPSLAWLQMVVWRKNVCIDIMVQMAVSGHRCPKNTTDALMRMWFLMDCPFNSYRHSLIKSQYFSDITLMKLTCFLIKLDMQFTDPVTQLVPSPHPIGTMRAMNGAVIGCELREYMMAERHLTTLWRVLHGWNPDTKAPAQKISKLDMIRLWARHKWLPAANIPVECKEMTAFGVPFWELGTARLERRGTNPKDLSTPLAIDQLKANASAGLFLRKLVRPDELVMRETIRREMSLHKEWVHYMEYGTSDALGRPYARYTEKEMNHALMHGVDLML